MFNLIYMFVILYKFTFQFLTIIFITLFDEVGE